MSSWRTFSFFSSFLWIKEQVKMSQKNWIEQYAKVGSDVFERSVYAELSPGMDFDPKQLESLKKKRKKKKKKGGAIEGFNTQTYVRMATWIHAVPQQKERQSEKQFVKSIPASVFKDKPAYRFSPRCRPCFSPGSWIFCQSGTASTTTDLFPLYSLFISDFHTSTYH